MLANARSALAGDLQTVFGDREEVAPLALHEHRKRITVEATLGRVRLAFVQVRVSLWRCGDSNRHNKHVKAVAVWAAIDVEKFI